MRTHQTPESSESGQGALELALSLPLFALLILASAEIGNLAWASVQVNNAARAGAAYASLSRANAASTTNIQTAAQNEAPNLTITATSTQVCSCISSGSSPTNDPGCGSTNLTNCPSPDVIQVSVEVNTSATVTTLIHYPGLPASYTLHAQATVGVEQ
ncbi:MAG TPA: TadE family protein [Acidobacteriaceae bacterium]|nr:TadE family protein [Acidobacteriaceae bacterium]